MWMCREEEADSERVRLGASLLDRHRRHNASRLDWIVTRRAAEHGWPVARARTYVRELLRYDVGEREIEAARLFLRMAAEAGLAPARDVRVLDLACEPV